MLSTARELSDFFARIDRWRQEVVGETLEGEDTRAKRLHAYELSHMKLRPRPTRPALAETSGNPVRKRKTPATGFVASTTKRRNMDRRSTKGKKTRTPGQFELPMRPESLPSLGSIPDLPPSSRSGSPSKPSTSPSRNRQLIDTITPDAAIDMNYLDRCDPAVKPTDFSQLRLERTKIAAPVLELQEKLHNTPTGFVPTALRHAYTQEADTPQKSKQPNLEAWYLDDAKTPFPERCLDSMKNTVEIVLEMAKTTHAQKAHERQWGLVASQLLCIVLTWQTSPRKIVVLNVESCTVGPAEFRVKKPEGAARIGDGASGKSDGKSKSASEDLGRMVDWCLAMNVDRPTMNLIGKGFRNCADNECSLNQSLSYIRNNPLILDIEIKKTLPLRNPEVQLAIWAGSALLKKRYHNWDTSMPMPAIAINGHSWVYYIFFELDDDLMMAGPYPFGATDTPNNIWGILYRLHVIMT